MVHSGFEASAVTDAFNHPLKMLKIAVSGIRTEGPMAPDIPLDKQRPAEFVFSRHVETKIAEIDARKSAPRRARTEARTLVRRAKRGAPSCAPWRESRARQAAPNRCMVRRAADCPERIAPSIVAGKPFCT